MLPTPRHQSQSFPFIFIYFPLFLSFATRLSPTSFIYSLSFKLQISFSGASYTRFLLVFSFPSYFKHHNI